MIFLRFCSILKKTKKKSIWYIFWYCRLLMFKIKIKFYSQEEIENLYGSVYLLLMTCLYYFLKFYITIFFMYKITHSNIFLPHHTTSEPCSQPPCWAKQHCPKSLPCSGQHYQILGTAGSHRDQQGTDLPI